MSVQRRLSSLEKSAGISHGTGGVSSMSDAELFALAVAPADPATLDVGKTLDLWESSRAAFDARTVVKLEERT